MQPPAIVRSAALASLLAFAPGVVASAITTTGSYSNIEAVNDGAGALALTQADVAFSVVRQGIATNPRKVYTSARKGTNLP